MRYKKIMLVALLLLAVLTISAVSASDETVTDALTSGDEVADVQLSHENDFNNVLSDENSTDMDDGDEPEWDGEDGVIFNVISGEDKEFNIEEDLNEPFLFISVSDELSGNIKIWENDDGEDLIFFEKSLSEIENKEADGENEGFTVYSISLSDFGENLNDVLDLRHFQSGFSQEDNQIDSRAYNVEYYDDDVIVKFWPDNGGDEEEDEGPWINIFVDCEKDYPTSGDADENFINIAAPNDFEGRVLIFGSKKMYFDRNLAEFESSKVQVADEELEDYSIYSISLKDVGFFEGADDMDRIEISVVDSEVIQSLFEANNYKFSLNDNSTFSLLEDDTDILIFYGNLTSGETEGGMNRFATDKFMEMVIPSTSIVDNVDIAVDYGDETKTYSLDDFNVEEVSDEEFSGKIYCMDLTDEIKNLIRQHENENITFNFNYELKGKTISLSFKRIFKDELFYKIVSISDLQYLFDFNIADDVLNSTDDEAVNIFCFDDNWHMAENDWGGGVFNIYVNDSHIKTVDLLSQLVHGAPQGVSFSLDDLGISTSDNYVIKITHLPNEPELEYDEMTGELIGYYKLIFENELISKDVVVEFEDDYEPIDPELTVLVSDINIGETATVNITINVNVTGKVTVDGEDVEITEGKGTYAISDLKAGNHTVTVVFEGDKYFNPDEQTATFKVNKLDSPISIAIAKDQYTALDDFAITVVNVTAVNTTINDKSYPVKSDGTVDIDTTALDAGTFTVVVSNAESDIYKANSTSKVFTIVKKASSVEVTVGSEYKVGDSFTIAVVNNTAASVTINDNPYAIKADGSVDVDTAALAAGSYTVKAVIAGDGKYSANETTKVFVISKRPSEVSINVGSAYNVGDNFTIEITNSTAARVTINGDDYAVENGKVVVDTSKLAAGEYTVVANISENDKYLASSSAAAFKLSKVETPVTNETIPVNGSAKESKTPTYSINLPNDATGNLTVTIGDKNYTAVVVNGTASVTVNDLPAGSYNVTIAYSGDAKYSPIVKNTTTKVVVDPKVVAGKSSVLYTAKYSVTVYGKDGKVAKNTKVVFYINGKKVKTVTTNSKGVATFNLPSNYVLKKYTIKATALGKSASKKVTVKQILSVKKVTVKKSAKKLVLTATLKKVDGKYLKGKKITFKFNGKKYTAKTNKKGVAKVTVKKSVLNKLKVGKKVTYQATYLKLTVKKNAKIKK